MTSEERYRRGYFNPCEAGKGWEKLASNPDDDAAERDRSNLTQQETWVLMGMNRMNRYEARHAADLFSGGTPWPVK